MPTDNTRDVANIGAAEYAEVVSQAAEYRLFTEALIESAELAYNNKDLTFTSSVISTLLRAACPQAYKWRVERLRKEKGLDE